MHLPGDGPHLVVSQLFHGAPLNFALSTLAAGATLHLMPRWDASDCVRRLADDVASTCMVPTMFRQLLALPADERRRLPTRALQTVLHGGEPCPVPVKQAMLAWFGSRLVEYYGFTEGGMTVATADEWLARPGTVGRAVSGGRILIVDDDGHELPPRRSGRVCFEPERGRVFSYRNAPEKTDSAHVKGDAFTAGDVGWLDEDGYLFLSGRAADPIVSGGENVYPAEVEDALYAVASVRDACVVAAPHEARGETVAAFVVLADGADRDAARTDIEATCAELLASYKRPRLVEFVDSVPRDATGKLLRAELRARLWQSAAS
jgi:long-chain acyl-CoA synthetase